MLNFLFPFHNNTERGGGYFVLIFDCFHQKLLQKTEKADNIEIIKVPPREGLTYKIIGHVSILLKNTRNMQ